MQTKDRVDIIIGMVCNGCGAMTVDDHLKVMVVVLAFVACYIGGFLVF